VSVSIVQVIATWQVDDKPQLSEAIQVSVRVRWQPLVTVSGKLVLQVTPPGVQLPVAVTLKSAQPGMLDGLQPRFMVGDGQPTSVGPVLTFQETTCTHVLVWLQTLSLKAVRDSMCGFRLYPVRSVLEVVDQDGVGTRMDFDVELLVKLVWRGQELRWIDTRVSYPRDGISHYRLLSDNLRVAAMHVRLIFGMLWRAPMILWRRTRRSVRADAANAP